MERTTSGRLDAFTAKSTTLDPWHFRDLHIPQKSLRLAETTYPTSFPSRGSKRDVWEGQCLLHFVVVRFNVEFCPNFAPVICISDTQSPILESNCLQRKAIIEGAEGGAGHTAVWSTSPSSTANQISNTHTPRTCSTR